MRKYNKEGMHAHPWKNKRKPLEEMASAVSPRSPMLNTALNAPLEFLPVTRFPEERADALQKLEVEKEKERDVIQSQPFTTPLICPTPKTKPGMVDNKLTGKKPTIFRPLEQRNVVGNLNQNQAVVHRQFNSPRPLYSQQNVAEAVYVQTGYNVGPGQPQGRLAAASQQPRPIPQAQNIPPPHPPTTGPVHMVPDQLPEFNPQKSPTFRAIIEMEGLGTLQPAPNTQTQVIRVPTAHTQKHAHSTAPTSHLNSVGMPNDRIAQSHSFRRLMLSLTE